MFLIKLNKAVTQMLPHLEFFLSEKKTMFCSQNKTFRFSCFDKSTNFKFFDTIRHYCSSEITLSIVFLKVWVVPIYQILASDISVTYN